MKSINQQAKTTMIQHKNALFKNYKGTAKPHLCVDVNTIRSMHDCSDTSRGNWNRLHAENLIRHRVCERCRGASLPADE